MKYKYTETQLREVVATSTSYRQALIKLGIAGRGGNYRVVKNAISKFNINVSHLKGQGWNKGIIIGSKRNLNEYLVNNCRYQFSTHNLRRRLIKEGVFEPVCFMCNRKTWLGHPIPLELDHIDGNHSNNELTNLRLLCPNCHALTPTYRGKNISKQLSSALPSLEDSPNLTPFT